MQWFVSLMRQTTIAVVIAAGLGGVVTLRHIAPAPSAPAADLQQAVAHLNAELQQLRQEREMPARVLNHSSGSICYIYATYTFGHAMGRFTRPMHIHISGTGFVVADGWIATNRHVAEPWWGEPHMETLRREGSSMRLEQLLAFFPGESAPLELTHVVTSADADLAVARFNPESARKAARDARSAELRPLPLATSTPRPGDAVLVLGYPMGIEGMLAKSPRAVTRRLAMEQDDFSTARKLASLQLIRPSATQGHLGDVVADKLLYDASTAQGASGSPVFNAQGEVIGVNTAYLDGFSGGGLGVSATKLRALLTKATRAQSAK